MKAYIDVYYCAIKNKPGHDINFSMELHYENLLCSKCMTRSFVTYHVNNIQA